jgi:serine/threonine-protein kinase RsbW
MSNGDDGGAMSETTGGHRFRCSAAANPATVTRVRRQLSDWLHASPLAGDERVPDVLLAAYEAMLNVAEYAYPDSDSPASVMDVLAVLDTTGQTLVVTVTDHGRWVEHAADPDGVRARLRGRGIPLMKALASETSVDSTSAGTKVRLTWTGLALTPT